MSKFQENVWNNLLYGSAQVIAQELVAHQNSNRRWVAIYNLKKLDEVGPHTWDFLKKRNTLYCIIDFEVPIHRVYDGVDEIFKVTSYYIDSKEEILETLLKKGYDAQKFDVHWKCDYPL